MPKRRSERGSARRPGSATHGYKRTESETTAQAGRRYCSRVRWPRRPRSKPWAWIRWLGELLSDGGGSFVEAIEVGHGGDEEAAVDGYWARHDGGRKLDGGEFLHFFSMSEDV